MNRSTFSSPRHWLRVGAGVQFYAPEIIRFQFGLYAKYALKFASWKHKLRNNYYVECRLMECHSVWLL
jgi:hypothetical protein